MTSDFQINSEYLIRFILVMSARDEYLSKVVPFVDMKSGRIDWKGLGEVTFFERDMQEEFFSLLSWAYAFYCEETPSQDTKNNFPWIDANIINAFKYVSKDGGETIIMALEYFNEDSEGKKDLKKVAIERWREVSIK